MKYIGIRDGRNSFELLCPVCQAEGEIGIKPDERRLIKCPNECGALFIHRRPLGMFGHPELVYVTGGQTNELSPANQK